MGIEPTWASLPKRGLASRLRQRFTFTCWESNPHAPSLEGAPALGQRSELRALGPARLPFRHTTAVSRPLDRFAVTRGVGDRS